MPVAHCALSKSDEERRTAAPGCAARLFRASSVAAASASASGDSGHPVMFRVRHPSADSVRVCTLRWNARVMLPRMHASP